MSSWVNWGKWGTRAIAVSDAVGTRANAAGAKMGVERFWPTSGDYILELEKTERILRLFTVEGLPTEETIADGKKKRKVYRKIPPKVIQDAKGMVIFNSMRTGIAPFAGAGGAGIVIARLPDGQWSAPSFISPNSYSAGLMFGLDVYQCILILRTEQAVKQFHTHNVTIGTEMAVAAGPLGYGISGETGLKNGQGFKTPIFSYVLSKGLFAGIEVVGQAFIDRFDENERVYHWPGIKAGNILSGKVRRPVEADKLYSALRDAEMGIAQGASLEWDTEEVTTLDLGEGEVLKLPPTPEQLMAYEAAGIKDEEDVKAEQEDRLAVRALPPPPRHPHARNQTARRSDASILSGRTAGLRSPNLGRSASQCSSPNADTSFEGDTSEYATQPDLQAITATSFAPPPRHPGRSSGRFLVPEPLHVPQIQQEGDEKTVEAVVEAQKIGQEAVKEAEEKEADRDPKRPEDGLDEVASKVAGLGISESQSTLDPPPLHHQDSSTSSISQYSDAAQTAVPPEYEAGDAPREVKEKTEN